MFDRKEAYHLAQRTVADLKTSVLMVLQTGGEGTTGRSNAEIGRCLGIHLGHKGHGGHIPRTMLALLESEGVVEQDLESKRWRIRDFDAPN